MEKLFHKINKYSYKLGNSIENNDIQKIDIYTKHHIHHFEQCGKAIIQSGGTMDNFKDMLGEYIDSVNALVKIYTAKLQEISSLNASRNKIVYRMESIYSYLEAKHRTVEVLLVELKSLKEKEALLVGGSIKNNNKINVAMYAKGAKHNMHYIQQYGKAIIQSGGTFNELKKSLDGYIAAVAQFLEKYNTMIQNYEGITTAIKEDISIGTTRMPDAESLIVTQDETIAELQLQISTLKEKLASIKVTIKSLVDKVCDEQMDVDKNGECHKNIQRIDRFLRSIDFSRKGRREGSTTPGPRYIFATTIYKNIKDNNIDIFKQILLSSDRKFKNLTFLQLIGLANIKIILKIMNVQVVINGVSMDASDEQFESANSLLTNNESAINAIAHFFYEKLLIPLLSE